MIFLHPLDLMWKPRPPSLPARSFYNTYLTTFWHWFHTSRCTYLLTFLVYFIGTPAFKPSSECLDVIVFSVSDWCSLVTDAGQLFWLWGNQGSHPAILAAVSVQFFCRCSSHRTRFISVKQWFYMNTTWLVFDFFCQVLQHLRLRRQTTTTWCLPWWSITFPHNTILHPEPLQVRSLRDSHS